MAKTGLGTGLGALIGSSDRKAEGTKSPFADSGKGRSREEARERVREVPLAQLTVSPLQPRKHFREEQLAELVDSIREHGVIQPLIVRQGADDKLELIAGERRWRACQRAGLATVPVILREATDRDVLEMALIENLQREDLDPIEEAQAFVRLAKEFDLRQEDIAKRVGKNRATVANAMRLLELDEDVQTHLAQGRIATGHAKVLLGLKDAEAQRDAADCVIKQGLTVRATERLVSQLLSPKKPEKTGSAGAGTEEGNPALAHLEKRLREHLATSVRLVSKGSKGRIEIEYYGNQDLDRLLELLGLKEEEL